MHEFNNSNYLQGIVILKLGNEVFKIYFIFITDKSNIYVILVNLLVIVQYDTSKPNNKILNHVERIKLFNFYLQNNTIQYDANIELESSNKLVIKKLAIQSYYG